MLPVPSTIAEPVSDARLSAVSVWAIVGVVALLGRAISRLAVYVAEAVSGGQIGALHVVFAVGWTVFMVWSEGHRGFHRGFSPRVAGRALAMQGERRWYYVVLAPLVAIGFLNSTPGRKLRSGLVMVAVVCAILLVRLLPQPWRGLVDIGVIAGLGWGVGSLLYWFVRGLRGATMPVPLDFGQR